MFRFVLVAVISCAMCLAVASPSVQAQSAIDARAATPERRDGVVAARYAMVDGHLHFLNFVQETFGMDALFAALDHPGVAEAVVLGMPLVKMWDEGDATRPTYYLDNDSRTYWYSATDFLVAHAVLSLPAQKRLRLHPFICGFNSADRNAVDLSWVLFEQEIAPGGTLDRRWVNLIEDYPGRFVIGSDTGDFSAQYASIVQRTNVLLDALTLETARKVAQDTFPALLPANRSAASGPVDPERHS